MNRKAIIIGIKGTKLTYKERAFLKREKPWGVILFSRNISNLNQLGNLIKKIRFCVHDKKYPILIDQEGGRVSRLNKIIDFSFFSQRFFGNLYTSDKKLFYYYYKIYINKISEILNRTGININTVPVLDIVRKSTHKIIGDRSYSKDAKIVSLLGKECVKLYRKNKIGTVIKHMPGHGLSKVDSHLKLPVVKEKKNKLIRKDFMVFKKTNSPFCMTAHIVYSSFDPYFVATHSRIIIKKIIRKYIGFKGVIISDDISMKALRYSLKENAIRAFNAGCNLVLHCNGNMQEMGEIIKVIPKIDNFVIKKTKQFYNFLR